jgi:hypothetical protein
VLHRASGIDSNYLVSSSRDDAVACNFLAKYRFMSENATGLFILEIHMKNKGEGTKNEGKR